MDSNNAFADSDRVMVRGIGLALPARLRTHIIGKAARLLRHHGRIIRVRIDLERDHANDPRKSAIAHGRIEISGPDLIARVRGTSLSQSVNLLLDKLDRMLRERTKHRVNRRNDRPPGAEFRDLIAPLSLQAPAI